VVGVPDVYAAGDVTSFPIKQGGLAAQQAEAAAEAIAADLGADLTARPFRPLLRGLLLTGGRPQYLSRDLAGGAGDAFALSEEPLWWPPAKIVGRYLGPFLAARAGVEAPHATMPPPRGAIAVDVDVASYRPEPFPFAEEREPPARTIADVMSGAPLVVAPEDTLGETAEKMRERDTGSVVVASFGKLVGILTSRDLLRAFAGRIHPSEARVREWMTAEPVVATTETSLVAAALLMTENGIHHLPVVDEGRPVGMVGLRDVARAARPPGLGGVGLGF
jgi:CBS domain-containing protein